MVKNFKVGDIFYCHNTGHMEGTDSVFALKGKSYRVNSVGTAGGQKGNAFFTDERGSEHQWPDDDDHWEEYFIIRGVKPLQHIVKHKLISHGI